MGSINRSVKVYRMDSDLYNLSSSDFQNSTKDAFMLLKQDTDFLDVTLACEDGKQVKAHKVVLISFSSVFQNILKNNSHSHPLLYLTGVEEQDVLNILDFIYLGEAKIVQDDLKRFMDIAEKFKINGLTSFTTNDDHQKPVASEETMMNAIEEEPRGLAVGKLKSEEFVDEYINDDGSMLDEKAVAEEEEFKPLEEQSKCIFGCHECNYKSTQSGSLKVHVAEKFKINGLTSFTTNDEHQKPVASKETMMKAIEEEPKGVAVGKLKSEEFVDEYINDDGLMLDEKAVAEEEE